MQQAGLPTRRRKVALLAGISSVTQGRVWLAAAAALLLVACGGQEPAEPQAASNPAPAAPLSQNPANVISARFACDGVDVRVRFEPDQAVLTVGDRTMVLPQALSASGARYADGDTVFWNKGREATFALDGREYACREVRDPWRDAEERGVVFRAVGQEPGWYLEIDSGNSMLLVYDYSAGRIETKVTRTGGAGETVYRSAGGPEVVVTVTDRACSDTMSGQPFPASVVVSIASADGNEPRELHGCGRAPGADQRWVASAGALGQVRIGMTVDEAATALGSRFEESPDRGECVYRRSRAVPAGVLFMDVGGRIVRIDVTSFGVRTDRGIGVGDAEDRVHDAYGSAVTTTPHKYDPNGRYLTIAGDDGHRLVFETDGQWITRYRIGRVPEVEWVEGCS